MGWWKNEHGDLVGDLPADRIITAMRTIAERTKRKPTLPQMLSIAAAAIATRRDALVSDATNVPKQPLARVLMRDGSQIEAEGSPPDAGAVEVLWDQFERVAADYLSTELERRPTLSELLASLAFVLRVEGTKYMEGVPDEIDIDRITVEQRSN